MRMLVLLMMLIPAGAAVGQEAAQPQTTEGARMVTLSECIKAALEKNLSIRVESYSTQISGTFVSSAKAVFDPQLKASIQDSTTKNQRLQVYDPTRRSQAVFDFTLSHTLETSTAYSVTFNNRRGDVTVLDPIFSPDYNPSYSVDLAFRITQPVLKNFGPSIVKSKIRVAMKDRETSEQAFRLSVMNVLTQVQQVYWNFVNSLSNLEVQRQSLKLAQDLLDQNRVRVQVGTLAPIDILQSEAEVASREEAIILAENSVSNLEDQLKALINLPGDEGSWSATIRPSDKPEFVLQSVSEADMLNAAFQKRPELIQARVDVEGKDINLAFAKNQLRPDLNLYVQAGSNGVGGTYYERDPETRELLRTVEGGYGDAVSDALRFKYPNWTFGVEFTLPLGNRAAAAAHEQAALAALQSALKVKNVELQVSQEVRAACRQLETNRKRVEATRAALRLAEKKLEAEQKKYSVGLTTNYFVLQFQKDLTQAQTNELQAITDYKLALVNLDKVTGTTLDRSNVELTEAAQ